jgi:hypothetical protein
LPNGNGMTAMTEAFTALCLFHGAGPGRADPSPPPRRRRPRPPPPPPRAVRSVPAARLGRSAPPLSSACCCSRRQAPAAAAARADGGPGAPAVGDALLLHSLGVRLLLRSSAPPLPFRLRPASEASVSLRPRRSRRPAPRSDQSPALTCVLRSRRRRDVGRRRNSLFRPWAPPAAGRTQSTAIARDRIAGDAEKNRSQAGVPLPPSATYLLVFSSPRRLNAGRGGTHAHRQRPLP